MKKCNSWKCEVKSCRISLRELKKIDFLQSFSDKQYNRPRNIIHWASCIPSSCNGDDLEVHLAEIVKRYENPEIRLKVHVPNDFCEVREEVPYEWPDLIFL